MSDKPLPAETPEAQRPGPTPSWLWALVGGVVLVALAAGGYGGFLYGRQYERSQGCAGCYPDETFWLLGASLQDSGGDVLIQGVADGGPAAAAGLQNDDRLITIDNQPVNSAADGRRILHDDGSGASADFTIERVHVVHQVTVTLAGEVVRVYPPIEPTLIVPPPTWEPPFPIPPGGFGERNIGVTYRMLQPGDPSGLSAGAMLIQVWTGGPADRAGLAPGDVILSVDGRDLSTDYTLSDALNTVMRRAFITLDVHKTSGDTITVRIGLFVVPPPLPVPYAEPMPQTAP